MCLIKIYEKMKKVVLLISLMMFVMVSTCFAEENDYDKYDDNPSAFFIRGGFSDITGYVAGEYIVNKLGISLGWHKYAPDITSSTASSVDIGVFFYGAPYYEDSWYLAAGYASANSVQTINGDLDGFYPTWSFVGGYRWGSDFMDIKIGCGYLTSEVIDGAAIDVSVGFAF